MRYDSEHKLKTRQRVLQAAAREIRADGPDRVGVAAVMAKAGLTHGGFYAHFASKDELVAEAIGEMFAGARRRLAKETEARTPAAGLSAYIDFYLSPGHRDARDRGCPAATLAGDAPRMTETARAAYAAGVRGMFDAVSALLAEAGGADADATARSMMAELAGALALARCEPDGARSDAILAASRRALKRRLGLPGEAA